MIKINVTKTGINELTIKLNQLPKRIAEATISAMNETADNVYYGLYKEMQSAFDRPTPYTLKALYINTTEGMGRQRNPSRKISGSSNIRWRSKPETIRTRIASKEHLARWHVLRTRA